MTGCRYRKLRAALIVSRAPRCVPLRLSPAAFSRPVSAAIVDRVYSVRSDRPLGPTREATRNSSTMNLGSAWVRDQRARARHRRRDDRDAGESLTLGGRLRCSILLRSFWRAAHRRGRGPCSILHLGVDLGGQHDFLPDEVVVARAFGPECAVREPPLRGRGDDREPILWEHALQQTRGARCRERLGRRRFESQRAHQTTCVVRAMEYFDRDERHAMSVGGVARRPGPCHRPIALASDLAGVGVGRVPRSL